MLCLEGAKTLKENLKYIPKEHRVYDIYLQAAQNVKGALKYIIESTTLRENEIYYAAVKCDADGNFRYIPTEDQTVDLAITAMRHVQDVDNIIPRIRLDILSNNDFIRVHSEELEKRDYYNQKEKCVNNVLTYEDVEELN